jgi:hypothetical protein
MDWNKAALALEKIAESVGINAMDYVPDDLPNQALYVGEIDIEPNQSFNKRKPDGSRVGTDAATITLRLLVARTTDKHAIRKMRAWMAGTGDQSLIQAIQDTNGQPNDYPWSGIVVKAARGNRIFVVGESKFYGTEIEVYVTGAA